MTVKDSEPKAEQQPPQATEESDELKVVVTLKGRRAIISVGAPGCDPIIQMVEVQGNGDPLLGAIACVPEVRDQARDRWTTAKLYPAHKAPPPASTPATARPAGTATTRAKEPKTTAKTKAAEPVQHTLPFL